MCNLAAMEVENARGLRRTARSSERIKCTAGIFSRNYYTRCKVGRGNTVDSIARIGARMPRVQADTRGEESWCGPKIIKVPSHDR